MPEIVLWSAHKHTHKHEQPVNMHTCTHTKSNYKESHANCSFPCTYDFSCQPTKGLLARLSWNKATMATENYANETQLPTWAGCRRFRVVYLVILFWIIRMTTENTRFSYILAESTQRSHAYRIHTCIKYRPDFCSRRWIQLLIFYLSQWSLCSAPSQKLE